MQSALRPSYSPTAPPQAPDSQLNVHHIVARVGMFSVLVFTKALWEIT